MSDYFEEVRKWIKENPHFWDEIEELDNKILEIRLEQKYDWRLLDK